MENSKPSIKRKFSPAYLYIGIVGVSYLILMVIFLFFPRSTYSELEKRDLSSPPPLDMIKSDPGSFTKQFTQWFSDTEPYRDFFMTLSMQVRDLIKFKYGSDEDVISFKPIMQNSEDNLAEEDVEIPQGNPMADENAKIAGSGIIIIGKGPNVRALMAYGGGEKSGSPYIDMVNSYAMNFPETNVYALVAPLATEFYLPEKASKNSKPEILTIQYIKDNLSDKVIFVDAYKSLSAHTSEDIYLRTDHHWAPLGAYYAASKLAKEAKVKFPDLDSYEKKVIKNFVGSMYGYSKDISVKQAPEDFVYYLPKGINYKTTFISYELDKNFRIKSETKPYESPFFKSFKDGSGNAYSTFMGGDRHLVKVTTDNKTNRKILFIKDSYGNALPGYFFYSFDEIHVVDFRYFTKNMTEYVKQNGITDIVLAFNVFNVCSSGSMKKVKDFITQSDGIHYTPTPEPTIESSKTTSETTDNTDSEEVLVDEKKSGEQSNKEPDITTSEEIKTEN